MVKKGKNESNSQLEKQMIGLSRELEEDFVKANEFLINDALNDDEENLNQQLLNEKDDLLIEKLRNLDGKKTKRLRTEVVKNELDVNITNNDTNSIHKIKTFELLNSLTNVSEAAVLKKMFSKTHKRTKTLETPLPKFVTEKAQRIATYTEDKKEVSKWDPVVKRNRKAEQLQFPLKQPDYSMQAASTFTKHWKPETEMEKQVAELLESSENNLKDQKLLTQAEQKAIQLMNLDEMQTKRQEFLKLKALQAYQENKFKRVKHIKSKRYRKILRKEKEKQEQKDMEKLEKDDPFQFKEVLDKIEKQRIKERMSLKHKNTSKWAKKQNSYAKYNDKARELVHEQLDLSKQLTKKLNPIQNMDSDDDDEAAMEKNEKASTDKNEQSLSRLNLPNGLLANNPWMKMISGLEKIAVNDERKNKEDNIDERSEYTQPKAFSNTKEIATATADLHESDDDIEDDEDDIIDRSNLADVKALFEDGDGSENEHQTPDQKKAVKNSISNKKANKNETNKQVKVTTSLIETVESVKETKAIEKNIKPLMDNNKISFYKIDHLEVGEMPKESNDEAKKNKNSHRITLSEAFADDDVIEEFRAEKRSIIESEKVKPIDLTKPGWGGWAGAGIDPEEAKRKLLKKTRRMKGNRRYRQKLVIRPQDVIKTAEDKKQLIRRDKNLDHVIISEKKDTTIAKYQISELPHQFKSVSEFETKIAEPVGRTWNPDFKFRKLITPKIKTKIGTIIEPIDKSDMVKNIKKKR